MKTNFNLFFWVLIAAITLNSCSKEELSGNEKIPEGWEAQKQIVVIEGQGYNVLSATNPDTDEMKYINEPKELTDFFEKYDETFVPHIVNDENNNLIVFFYKSWTDYKETIIMEPYRNDTRRTYDGGESNSYEHVYLSSNRLQQKLLTYKWFDFGAIQAWGQSNSHVESLNDKITLVTLTRYNPATNHEYINYMGCQHSNWGGRRFIITFVTNLNYDSLLVDLRFIPFTKINGERNWNDRISSIETWQAWYNPPHWNNPTF